MAQTIKHIRSAVAGKVPTTAELDLGVLAINTHDGKAFLKKDDGTESIVEVTTPAASTSTAGKVQLEDSTSSTSTTKAATPNSVKAAYDLANGKAAASHTHGNITNAGAIGTTANLPVITTTSGVLTTGSFGTGANTFCQGNDSRLSDTRTPTDSSVTNDKVASNAAIAGSKISPDFGSQTVTTTGVFSAAAGAAATPSITFTGDLNTGIYSPGADQVAISTAGTGRLFVTSAGLVGIGTSSPGSLLDIGSGSSAGLTQLTLKGGSAAADYGIFSIQNGSTARGRLVADAVVDALRIDTGGSAAGKIQLYTGSSYTHAVTIDSSQRVGIGTTSPGSALSVTSSATTPWFIFRGTTSGYDYGTFTNSAAQVLGYLGAGNSALSTALATDFALRAETNLVFASNGNTERARIDSSGRLLVGTSSAPTGTLSASSLAHIRGNTASSSGGGQLNLSSNQTSAGLTGLGGNYHLGRIIFTDTQAGEYAHITCTVDTNNAGVGSYPGRLVFSTTADGASSPTERLRITSTGQVRLAGAGITFNGDTATANELDDYEEGTWTPTWGSQINPPTGANGVTVISGSTKYVKIGSLVHVVTQITLNNASGNFVAGTTVEIGGLPFSAVFPSNRQGPVTGFSSNGSDTALFIGHVNTGTIRFGVAFAGGTGAGSVITLAASYNVLQ